jgi:ornithine--oxo-acid transaminase
MGEIFRNEISALHSQHIKDVRGRGLLNAIEIGHTNPDAAWDLCLKLKDYGLLAKPTHGDKIRFAPPLVITKPQIMEAVEMISNSLNCLD